MATKIPLVTRFSSGIAFEQLQSGDDLSLGTGTLFVGTVVADNIISGHDVLDLKTVTNNQGSAINICEPVYLSAADTVKLAKADDAATANVIGLVYDTSIADSSPPGDIITRGTLTATTAQWDAVTGESGGLTPGAEYYLSAVTAGRLTQTPPRNLAYAFQHVGTAFSTTDMRLELDHAEQVEQITADTTIYVDTTGSDTTGDGSVSAPYLTIFRAMEHVQTLLPGEFEIHIDLSVGVHTVSKSFQVAYPFGNSLFWDGKFEDVSSPTISSIDASATTGSSPYTDLEYVDFDLDLSSASNVAVGHFVRLTGCTGGTNPQALDGLHEIVALASGVATCRVWRKKSTTELPSGAITVSTARIIETVLSFTANDHGIFMAGPIDVGHWDAIVVKGNDTAVSNSKRGVRLFNSAAVRAASESGYSTGLYVHQWGTGYEVVGNATAYVLRGGISKIVGNAIRADLCGVVLQRFASTINGVTGSAIIATTDASVFADTAYIHSCGGNSSFVQATTSGYVDVSSAVISFDQGSSGLALFADNGGFIHAESATLTGFVTDYNPEADTVGNGFSFINTTGGDFDYQPSHTIAGYSDGSNYVITGSSAEVNEGTDSAIVIDEAGSYMVSAWAELYYNGATYATSSTLTLKLRRTNNTAADLTDSSVQHQTFQLTTFTGSIHLVITPVVYTTTNTDDRIALFVDVASTPSAGDIEIVRSHIFAEKLAQ